MIRRRRAALVLSVCAVAATVAAAVVLADEEEPRPRPAAPAEPVATCPEPLPGLVSHEDRDARRVAITFDDGPSEETAEFLRALERRDARGTFFVLGLEIPGREEVLRQAVEAGHEVGNHSTSHAPLPDSEDIETTSELIEEATGRPPCVFRPPMGRYGERLLADANELGMTTVTWDVDPLDWASQDAAGIRDRTLAAVEPGSIVLLHDGGGERFGTARALSALIDGLRERGYELVTVSELLREKR